MRCCVRLSAVPKSKSVLLLVAHAEDSEFMPGMPLPLRPEASRAIDLWSAG